MVQQSHRGVPLDLCEACHGVWFDGGELEAYNAGSGPTTLSAAAGLDRAFQPTGESTLKRCPRCGRDILRTGSIGRHCVMRCTSCGGVFLPWPEPERGEHLASRALQAAIRALKEMAAGRR
jgi:Zn-finger nucleic acid-binding protein